MNNSEKFIEEKYQLIDINTEVDRLVDHFQNLVPGWHVNHPMKKLFKMLIHKFPVDVIYLEMANAVAENIEFDEENKVTKDSVFFSVRSTIHKCAANSHKKDCPDIEQLFYIRAILKNRILKDFNSNEALQYLKTARGLGISIEQLFTIARSVKYWCEFTAAMEEVIQNRNRDGQFNSNDHQ